LKEGFDAAVEATGELEILDPLNQFFRNSDGDAQNVRSGLRSHDRTSRVGLWQLAFYAHSELGVHTFLDCQNGNSRQGARPFQTRRPALKVAILAIGSFSPALGYPVLPDKARNQDEHLPGALGRKSLLTV
jgi:hypothetical protein